MKKFLRGSLLFLVFVVLSGCDSVSEVESLTVTIFQRLSAEDPLVQVGQTDVPFDDPIDVSALPRTEVRFEEKGFWMRVFSEEAADKDLVVFYVFRELRADPPDFVRPPRVELSSVGSPPANKAAPMTLEGQAGFDGVVYGFFIEGIGDTPTLPVTVRIEPGDQVFDVVIDPKTNMVPLRYVRRLRAGDLDLLDQPDDFLEMQGVNPLANDTTAYVPLLVFNGVVPILDDGKVRWFDMSPLGPVSGASWEDIRLVDDLQWYAFMFKGW